MQMSVIFLGTSSAVPTAKRSLSSVIVRRNGEIMIFDAGEGMQRNFLQTGIGTNKKMQIFITHMHSDHVIGLLGFLQTLSLQSRSEPVRLYGPDALIDFIESNMKLLNFSLTFPLIFKPVEEGIVVEEREYLIRAIRAEHSVRAYSYCIEEYPRPGVFYPEKAQRLGIPKGHLWHKLQHGESIKIDDRVIYPHEVSGEKRAGRKIGISGDTRVNDRLVEFFANCDLLIFDSTYAEEHKDNARENMHSTAKEAAMLASKGKVKLLVLTHFSARYDNTDLLVKEALELHPNVIAAEDLMRIEVPYRD